MTTTQVGIFSRIGILPSQVTKGSACYDVFYAPEKDDSPEGYKPVTGYSDKNSKFERVPGKDGSVVFAPYDRILVPTGLFFDIPEGLSIRALSRSSMALKRGFIVANSVGVIDSDYVDELYMLLYNATGLTQKIELGERIGQIEPFCSNYFEWNPLKKPASKKGNRTGGLGSTGK